MTGKLCDITLVANEAKFTAHRIVLAASIPYFHAMFLHEMAESRQAQVRIGTLDAAALEQLINYSYNGSVTISAETVQPLLVAANFLQLTSIKRACCDFVKVGFFF